MKKVLYITNTALDLKGGNGTNGSMHYQMVSEIIGNDLYAVFISGDREYKSKREWITPLPHGISKAITAICGYPPYLSLSTKGELIKIIRERNIDIVYIDNSVTGKFIKEIKRKFPSIEVIAFFHDIEKILLKDQSKGVSFLRKASLKVMIQNEEKTVKYADKTIVLNSRDNLLYKSTYNATPNYIIPVTVPVVTGLDFDCYHEAGSKLEILFVGVDYTPNVHGILWFVEKVSPLINCNYQVTIVGYNMERYKRILEEHENITVIGTVESLSPFYKAADVVITPIFEGGGMKVKTAEALSYGKVIVGLKESLIGYWECMPNEFKNKQIFQCDSPEKFAKIINILYNNKYKKCNEEIVDWMKDEFSYQVNLEKYRALF